MLRYIFILILPIFFMTACSSFVQGGDTGWLKEYEGGDSRGSVYRLLKKIDINGKVLPVGTSVRVIIVTDSDWIKVYAYRASGNPLRDDRFLGLYLFKSDFPNEEFNREYFQKEFSKVFLKK